jgi:hypothetical protein
VPAEDFDRADAQAGQPRSLVEFFRAASTGGGQLDLTRRRDATRTITW